MDFVYDLTDKFKEQGIDYFLITIRKGNDHDAADVFYRLQDQGSSQSLLKVFKKLASDEELLKELLDENGTSKNTSRSKSAKKTPSKKRGRPRKKKGGDEK
tara:strand:- start:63 stop:365 length:303 start_codon:yes stop_codon:yes gene_type:complete